MEEKRKNGKRFGFLKPLTTFQDSLQRLVTTNIVLDRQLLY